MYTDYKFVPHKELEALGLSHLIGTESLRAAMHGYFMDMRLYTKVSPTPGSKTNASGFNIAAKMHLFCILFSVCSVTCIFTADVNNVK